MRISTRQLQKPFGHFHPLPVAKACYSGANTRTEFAFLRDDLRTTPPPQLVLGNNLGEGAFAWVKQGTLQPRPAKSAETFAVKFFKPPGAHSPANDHEKHCAFEATMGMRIDSPFVTQTYGHGKYFQDDAAYPFILKEFVPGNNFYDWGLKDLELGWDHPTQEGYFASMDTLKIARGLAQGIQAFHQEGLLYLDLSVHNFLCDLLGDQIPKLHDLGSVTPMDKPSPFIAYDDEYTAPEVIDYLATEQRSKSERRITKAWSRVGRKADLFSLGMVFFKLNAEKPEPRILALAEELIHKDPGYRPPSIEWVLDQL